MGHNTHTQQKVEWGGYLAFFITIILFSGMFAKSTEWWRVFDFTVLNGAFGQINAAGDTAVSFRGTGGVIGACAGAFRHSFTRDNFRHRRAGRVACGTATDDASPAPVTRYSGYLFAGADCEYAKYRCCGRDD